MEVGGIDFPAPENEIAQCLCDKPSEGFSKYWMHNGYLMSEGEKMSKSLGNFYTVNELLREYPGEAIRLLLLKTHYRQPLDFTKSGLDEAKRELDRFYGSLRGLDVPRVEGHPADAVVEPLTDDLNTPLALSALHASLRDLNNAVGDDAQSVAAQSLLRSASVLGLLEQDPEDWFRWRPANTAGLDDDAIEDLVHLRTEARAAKDFALSDRIRDELVEAGVLLEDKPDGTVWAAGLIPAVVWKPQRLSGAQHKAPH